MIKACEAFDKTVEVNEARTLLIQNFKEFAYVLVRLAGDSNCLEIDWSEP